MYNRFVTYAIILVLLSLVEVRPQSMGFGCLGLVGGYGGYSYQKYKPTGLNNYVAYFNNIKQDSISAPLSNFGKATGFRVGINLFRANITGFLFTAKGYYQQTNEKTDATVSTPNWKSHTTISLKLKTLAIGFDLGTSLSRKLGWKILDAAVLFNTPTLNITEDHPNGHTIVNNYNSEKTKIGYSVGTGFIFNLIDNYITLEGTAAYTIMKINRMRNTADYLTENESSTVPMDNFIESGGINAVIQLNIGFPL